MYQAIHRMIFTNDNENVDTIIHIIDTTPAGSTTINDMKDDAGDWLTMSANLSTANDGEDKLSQIRSLKFKCEFLSTDTYNVDFFLQGVDNRWLVQVFIGSTSNPPIFTGYLVPEGAKEIFLDHGLYGVELTASDLLASLSEPLLKKPDGTIPRGKFTIIEFIAWSLQKTFLQLPIKVVYNLREETQTGPDDCFFKMIYLNSYTFETEINELEDCLSVIQKLLLGCFITQYNGEWWIIRVDEMDNLPYRIYSFAADGTYTGVSTANYLKRIGINESISWINEDTEIYPHRQKKQVQQNFKIETWKELIKNIDFSRGPENNTIDPYSPLLTYPNLSGFPPVGDSNKFYKAGDTGKYYIWKENIYSEITAKAYDLEDWALSAPFISGTLGKAYIRREIQNGFETDRVLVFDLSGTASGNWNYLTVNEQLPLFKGDKFNFSINVKFQNDVSGVGSYWNSCVLLKLNGDDGSIWLCGTSGAMEYEDDKWTLFPSGVPFVPNRSVWSYQKKSDDQTLGNNIKCSAPPTPVNGKLEIAIIVNSDVSNPRHFWGLQFEYIPIINGVYQKVAGQRHRVSAANRVPLTEQIFISEAVSPNWKGVLFKYDGLNHQLIGNIYDYRLTTAGALGLDRFGVYQAFALWNQYNRIIRTFQGTLLGLDTDTTGIPTMVHKYQLTDPSNATDNKLFQLLGFDMDLATCQWKGTFADVYDTTSGKDYSSDHEFDYISKL